MDSFADRLARVHAAIAAAAAKAGRRAEEVQLVAVSKTHPPEAVAEAVAAGQSLFGENRVQEAKAKIPLAPTRARWHLIGHLQKNKIRQALPLFELIHSIDSLELARDLHRIAEEEGFQPKILLEVNLAGESTKFGFKPDVLARDLEAIIALHRLDLEGLMVIPPPVPKAEDSRRYFVQLRELRDRLETDFRLRLPELSMGMSVDYPVAVEEGATLVRVGTALFGERAGKTWRPPADEGM
jgi:hypothetical protein